MGSIPVIVELGYAFRDVIKMGEADELEGCGAKGKSLGLSEAIQPHTADRSVSTDVCKNFLNMLGMATDSLVIILEPVWCLLSLPGDLGAALNREGGKAEVCTETGESRDMAEVLVMPTVVGRSSASLQT